MSSTSSAQLTYAQDDNRAEKGISEVAMKNPSEDIKPLGQVDTVEPSMDLINGLSSEKNDPTVSESASKDDQADKHGVNRNLLKIWADRRRRAREEDDKIQGMDQLRYLRLKDRVVGLPRLSAFLNSDPNFAIMRGFGELHCRVLLHREIELTTLEKELQKLDKEDEQNPDMEYRLRTIEYFDDGEDERRELVELIEERLSSYDDFLLKYNRIRSLPPPSNRNYLSVFRRMWNTKPLYREQDDFIYEAEDFVAVGGNQNKWYDDCLELFFNHWPKSVKKTLWQGSKLAARSDIPSTYYYDRDRIKSITKFVSGVLAVALIIGPVAILFHCSLTKRQMMGLVLGSALVFSLAISLLTEAKRVDVFFGTAAYCGVLVVFLGNLPASYT